MSLLKNLFITAVMYLAAVPFLLPAWRLDDAPVHAGIWFLVAASAVMNLIVISYHYTVPAHPKFLMVPWRRWLLRVHITSGTVELVAGLSALLLDEPEVAARVMAAAALLFHVPSAYAQTPIVFGARAIMRPSYIMCIGLHAFCALKLWMHPSSEFWAAATFLVFNVYVWCRIYYFLFDKLGLFQGARYSVTIIMAGLTTTPVVLGPPAMLVLLQGAAIYMLLYWLISLRRSGRWPEFVREAARDSALSAEVRALWESGSDVGDPRAVEELFARLDSDGDGRLSAAEVKKLLIDSHISPSVVDRFLEARVGEALDREGFSKVVWPVREVREHAFLLKALDAAKSDRDKAALVFERLDLDHDGYLGRLELEALLREWSMPPREVDRWLVRTGAKDKEKIGFSEFFEHLRPVWRFVYYDVVEAYHGRREDMIKRAMTAHKDAAATQRVRKVVERELAKRVPFLSVLDEDALDELAASLVEENVPAGCPLFTEGTIGDTFYLVRAGRLRVSRGGERLADLGAGDYLGEGSLLTEAPRSATATALEDSVVLGMTRASFRYFLEREPVLQEAMTKIHEGRRLSELHRALQRDLLGTVPFLKDASPSLLVSLVEALQAEGRKERPAGDVVFEEGEPGDAFYLVGSGAVRIVRRGETVAELGAGGFFGEGALLSGEPRVASAVVERDAVLYALARSSFEVILERFPDVAEAVKESHDARRASHHRGLLHRLPFLKDASGDVLDELARSLTSSRVPAGETLFREGDAGECLYLIIRGAVRVERGGVPVAELGDGAFFGERALFENQPRAATIVAARETELLSLAREPLERVLGRSAALPASGAPRETAHAPG